MGAFGRGGSRLGSGRKPKTARERWLTGNAGKRPITLVSPPRATGNAKSSDHTGALEVPPELTVGARAYWAAWAPLAQARGLLTKDTTPGMALLCEQAHRAAVLWSSIETMGLTAERVTVDGAGQEHREARAHPLLTHWRALEHRIEQLMARYGIAADGKVAAAPAVDPHSEAAELASLLAIK